MPFPALLAAAEGLPPLFTLLALMLTAVVGVSLLLHDRRFHRGDASCVGLRDRGRHRATSFYAENAHLLGEWRRGRGEGRWESLEAAA